MMKNDYHLSCIIAKLTGQSYSFDHLFESGQLIVLVLESYTPSNVVILVLESYTISNVDYISFRIIYT